MARPSKHRGARDLAAALRERVRAETGPALPASPHRVAMAYPSPYAVGMSSLGYQRITMLLREAGIAAERVFLPDDPDEHERSGTPPLSCETGTPLGRFPVIAVSFAYETELLGLFRLLDLAGVPVLREERNEHHPRILIGGPITMASPTFLAPFADAMLLGEAEDVVVTAVAEALRQDREAWLDTVAALPGGWVPERDGARLPAMAKASERHLPARSAWLAPEAELSSMFLLEGERGCHRACAFCVLRRTTNGGMRLVDGDRVLSLVPDEARKVGLVGAAISDHPELPRLLEALVASGRQVSVSSLRADRIAKRPGIAHWLRQSGARTLTTASDGASERLRRAMSKGTTHEHLLACAQQAGSLGFDIFKVYMMIGVPGETEADLDELVASTRELAAAARPARLALGVAPFAAKRQTPLDGQPFAGIKVVEERLKRLDRSLRGAAEVRPASARWAWVEHELAQGGAEAGLAMLTAWRAGGTFSAVKRALLEVDPATRRPWTRYEAPLVDPIVRRPPVDEAACPSP
ncbi:MAG: radical SAM protein [Alphaproteobacteria bacterium]|nr:radical SAM protein [Alphaproteobacteria bacterium]